MCGIAGILNLFSEPIPRLEKKLEVMGDLGEMLMIGDGVGREPCRSPNSN